MDMTIDASGETVTSRATASTSSDGKAGPARPRRPDVGKIEERIVDGVIYIDSAASAERSSAKPAGKHWVSSTSRSCSGAACSAVRRARRSAARRAGAEYLQGLSGDVQRPRRARRSTASTPRTTAASIDYDKLRRARRRRGAEGQLAKLGDVPADVWINDDDRS